MQILFENGTLRGLARFLVDHTVEEARVHGWEEFGSGELIDSAEKTGFDLMITADKNIWYQQNLEGRKLALIVPQHLQ